MKGILVGAIAFGMILGSCNSESDCTKVVQQSVLDEVNAAQLAIDNAIIQDYIVANSNSIGTVQEVNGIKYVITKEGSGVTPCLENSVMVAYTGRLLSNGQVFDKSLTGATFPLNQLILGWRLSFPSFTKGTVATIFIPSGYAYGVQGVPSAGIPANANLIFDVDLINVR